MAILCPFSSQKSPVTSGDFSTTRGDFAPKSVDYARFSGQNRIFLCYYKTPFLTTLNRILTNLKAFEKWQSLRLSSRCTLDDCPVRDTHACAQLLQLPAIKFFLRPQAETYPGQKKTAFFGALADMWPGLTRGFLCQRQSLHWDFLKHCVESAAKQGPAESQNACKV